MQDVNDGAHALLCELLPFQWCSLNYKGNFVPVRSESAVQWGAVQNAMVERLKQLQEFSEEEAIPPIGDIIQKYGTIFHVEPIQQEMSLHDYLQGKILSPQDALQLFTPVLDTLAGLHQENIFHGAISDTAIRLQGGSCILRDWMSCPNPSRRQEDVRAVSVLLYQAMTGETIFHEETAQQLPETVRNALYNGIYDIHMSIADLWHQLHAKRPVKRVQPIQLTEEPLLTFPMILKLLLCCFFVWLCFHPFHQWSIWKPKSLTATQKAENVLPDINYHVPENCVQLPELLYLPKEEAIQKAQNLGLRVVMTKRIQNPVIEEGRIVTQAPHAGAVLQMGDTVTLAVSQGWESVVPDVSDMPVEKATQILQNLGFVVETETAVSDSTAPNSVISQDAEPNTLLERESVIHLLVSLGQKDIDSTQTISMPDCSGMTFAEAKTMLSERFLYAVLDNKMVSETVPAGQIVSQSVPNGEPVPQGATIRLVVSLGAEQTSVPDVTAMKADEAKIALEEANLRCVLCYVSDGEHEIDTVIQQNYEPETILPINTEVWLNVSVGTASSVESLGGWSGNPLPDPNAPAETDVPPAENEDITNPPLPN